MAEGSKPVELREGVVYVVQRDRPYGSGFMKGDRVVMTRRRGNSLTSGYFTHEDGRTVVGSAVNVDALMEASVKKLTRDDIKPDVVYVVLTDEPCASSFRKGDRVKMMLDSGPRYHKFMHEDGRMVDYPCVPPEFLAFAEKEEVKVAKKLTDADLKHGEVYVVLEDEPSWSSFKKGDRIMMVPGTKPQDHHFQHADGRHAERPYVGPEALRRETAGGAPVVEGPKWVAATPDDLKVGAVFKVEDGIETHYHTFPVGTLVEFTGRFHGGGSTVVKMVALNGTKKGTEQWLQFKQISLLVPGTGDVIAPAPKKGTGILRKTATRSDGHDFKLMDCGKAGYYVEAGCRWFTMAEAAKHWEETRKGTDLGNETFDILYLFNKHIDRLNAAKKKG
jgi:hypothetical protein